MRCIRCGNENKFWDFPVNKYTVTIPSLYVSVNKVKVKPEHRLYDDRQIHVVTHPYLVKYSLLSVFFILYKFQLMPAIGSRHLLHNTVNSLEWHCRAVDNVLFFWSKMCLFDTFCTYIYYLYLYKSKSAIKYQCFESRGRQAWICAQWQSTLLSISCRMIQNGYWSWGLLQDRCPLGRASSTPTSSVEPSHPLPPSQLSSTSQVSHWGLNSISAFTVSSTIIYKHFCVVVSGEN